MYSSGSSNGCSALEPWPSAEGEATAALAVLVAAAATLMSVAAVSVEVRIRRRGSRGGRWGRGNCVCEAVGLQQILVEAISVLVGSLGYEGGGTDSLDCGVDSKSGLLLVISKSVFDVVLKVGGLVPASVVLIVSVVREQGARGVEVRAIGAVRDLNVDILGVYLVLEEVDSEHGAGSGSGKVKV